jgi:hypothetical protein
MVIIHFSLISSRIGKIQWADEGYRFSGNLKLESQAIPPPLLWCPVSPAADPSPVLDKGALCSILSGTFRFLRSLVLLARTGRQGYHVADENFKASFHRPCYACGFFRAASSSDRLRGATVWHG